MAVVLFDRLPCPAVEVALGGEACGGGLVIEMQGEALPLQFEEGVAFGFFHVRLRLCKGMMILEIGEAV